MPSDFDDQAPPVGEAYNDSDGVTIELLRYEHVALHGMQPAPSILLSVHSTNASTDAGRRYVALDMAQRRRSAWTSLVRS